MSFGHSSSLLMCVFIHFLSSVKLKTMKFTISKVKFDFLLQVKFHSGLLSSIKNLFLDFIFNMIQQQAFQTLNLDFLGIYLIKDPFYVGKLFKVEMSFHEIENKFKLQKNYCSNWGYFHKVNVWYFSFLIVKDFMANRTLNLMLKSKSDFYEVCYGFYFRTDLNLSLEDSFFLLKLCFYLHQKFLRMIPN